MIALTKNLSHLLNAVAVEVNTEGTIELLDLAELYEPKAFAFTFETLGWYILGTCILILVLFFLVKFLLKYKKDAYRRKAFGRILLAEQDMAIEDVRPLVNEIFVVLKQVAIEVYGRTSVASLYGKEWLAFLEGSGKDTLFLQLAPLLEDTLTTRDRIDKVALSELIECSKKWIQTHA